jgi:hypothetical protein
MRLALRRRYLIRNMRAEMARTPKSYGIPCGNATALLRCGIGVVVGAE